MRGEPGRGRPAAPVGLAGRAPKRLDDLAAAWQEESAWQGQVSAGGIDMSAEDNALVATEELVMHGWDIARATGRGPGWSASR